MKEMLKKNGYAIGIDYGTLSARAVVVSCASGQVMGESVAIFPHGVVTGNLPDGTPLPADAALAEPQDYKDALVKSIRGALEKSGVSPDEIIGIGIDATAYTMVPCLSDGTVVSELPGFEKHPMAYIKLWKHHAAAGQADRIQALYENEGKFAVLENYAGTCNCEYALPKLLETYEEDRAVFDATERFCDLGEWLALLLTGKQVHSLYSAGFKGLWSEKTGWPEKDELDALADGFAAAFFAKFAGEISDYSAPCGVLKKAAAERLGLKAGIPVAVPMGDGSTPGLYFCAKEPKTIAITVGTSMAMSFTSDEKMTIGGINGVTFGGMVPGRWSYDAGTPCAGDMLDWFCKAMVPSEISAQAEAKGKGLHEYLSEQADKESWSNSVTVLDWWNGNRCVLNNMALRGNVLGMGLSTTTADLYCAFVQSIACSIRIILEHFAANGLPFDKIVLCGGIPLKNGFLVRQIASVLGRPVEVSEETLLTAVSSAILGAMAGGMEMGEAIENMASAGCMTVEPDAAHGKQYDEIYGRWKHYHDLLGEKNA